MHEIINNVMICRDVDEKKLFHEWTYLMNNYMNSIRSNLNVNG